MTGIGRLNYIRSFFEKGPIILLFISVLNDSSPSPPYII